MEGIESHITDDKIENEMPLYDIKTKHEPLSIDLHEPKIDFNPMTIILANDTILKTLNQDIETILEVKNSFHSTNELYFTIIIIYITLTLDI
ncbi:unnamed protein product [Rotaria sp. Silwood2]|nr:unnamed protein product [Rotaria sp. Silwood2]CAF4338599.1 unnamed protein product [Rotaria sp. Silwood2]CAF4452037.1 unnamed protein product [Rotaria sp. Silwood2]